jgi:hypothetical protein
MLRYDESTTSPIQQLVSLKDVEVTTRDGNEMGQVVYGYLRLRGLLIPSATKLAADKSSASENRLEIQIRQCSFDFVPDFINELGELGMAAICYSTPCLFIALGPLFQVEGLVLRPTGSKGQFKRVGFFSSFSNLHMDTVGQFEKAIIGRGNDAEKALMTEDLYEEYDEEEDRYTFSII